MEPSHDARPARARGPARDLPQALRIDVRRSGRTSVLVLSGDLDVHAAHELRQALARAAEGPRPEVVVDLTGVTFLDSVALGVLVVTLRWAVSHDGSLDLVCSDDRLLRLFRITRLDATFRIHEDLAAALA